MNTAASLRAIPAVAAFDTTDQLAAYGFKVADPRALELARKLVDDVVSETLRVVDQHFTGMKTIGQNPYRDTVSIARQEVRYAALVQVFDHGWLPSRVDQVFSEPGLPRPALANLHQRIVAELGKKLEVHGFELMGSEQHRDGTLSQIAVRDPLYAHDAATQARTAALDGLDGLATALMTLANSDSAPMGIRNMSGATTAAEIGTFVNTFVDTALIAVRDHLQGVMNAGGSPYEDTPVGYQKRYTHIIDKSQVRTWRQTCKIKKSAIIRLADYESTCEGFERRFLGRATIDRDAFVMYLASAVGKRLQSYPELRAAAVCLANGKFGQAYEGWRLVGVFTPEPRTGPIKRAWQALFGKPKTLALPPPERLALAAAAKPAPIEIGPANWRPTS